MPCDFDRIDALLAGSLDEKERETVLAHIDSCAACRAYYQALLGLECEAAPSESFTARVMDEVRRTPQQKKRAIPYRRTLAGLAACAVLVLGLRLLPLANNDAPSGARSVDGNAIDLPLAIYTLDDAALCDKVRDWLAQQGKTPLYSDGLREAYDLTAQEVRALNLAISEVDLPEQMLQLELKSAE